MNGKGDTYRPVNKKQYDKNYERIFGKKGKHMNNEQLFIVGLVLYVLTLFAHEAIEHPGCVYGTDTTFTIMDSTATDTTRIELEINTEGK